eukprot:g12428.t1
MAPVASCGFAVHATKKGELPLKVEKRAKGKKVTIIGNVSGDATRLSRGLQTMLGVGGSVRQAERGSWSVEVQGDQVPRVTKALLDFQCLHGLSSRCCPELAHWANERTVRGWRQAEFYGQFWESAISSGDFLDIFEVEVQELPPGQTTSPRRGKLEGPELNMALQTLGLLAECGKAVREFWQNSGMSLQQFRKMAMNPGARMVAEGPGRREEGWCRAMLSYSVPLPVPASGLSKEDTDQAAKKALRALESRLSEDFSGVERSIPGVTCFLDVSTFGLERGRKALTPQDKDEMRLEKKLREILALKRRQVEGEKLEKLQAEKVQKRVELFQEVAELKLRRAEKDWARLAEVTDDLPRCANASAPFGVFNQERCDGPVTVSSDQVLAESAAPRWVGVPLHVPVKQGEVAAFTVEIMRGTVEDPDQRGLAVWGGFGMWKLLHQIGLMCSPHFGPFSTGEAEREDGRLRIGFAHNSEPLGVAFDVRDQWPEQSLTAVVSGKNFKVQLISAEAMPLEDPPDRGPEDPA